jgi:hypothetical protein
MSGEREGQRERIDVTIRQMIKGGANPDYAKQKARQAALKEDRKNSK